MVAVSRPIHQATVRLSLRLHHSTHCLQLQWIPLRRKERVEESKSLFYGQRIILNPRGERVHDFLEIEVRSFGRQLTVQGNQVMNPWGEPAQHVAPGNPVGLKD